MASMGKGKMQVNVSIRQGATAYRLYSAEYTRTDQKEGEDNMVLT